MFGFNGAGGGGGGGGAASDQALNSSPCWERGDRM